MKFISKLFLSLSYEWKINHFPFLIFVKLFKETYTQQIYIKVLSKKIMWICLPEKSNMFEHFDSHIYKIIFSQDVPRFILDFLRCPGLSKDK